MCSFCASPAVKPCDDSPAGGGTRGGRRPGQVTGAEQEDAFELAQGS